MRTTPLTNKTQLARKALTALMKALGPVDTARFLAPPVPKRMESVRRHREWQRHANKQGLLDAVFRRDG